MNNLALADEEVQSKGLEAHASLVCEQLDLDRASSSASRIGKEALSLCLEGDRVWVPAASALVASIAEGTSVLVPKSNLVISPAWSRVLKEGRHQKYVSENVDVRPKPCANQPKRKEAWWYCWNMCRGKYTSRED